MAIRIERAQNFQIHSLGVDEKEIETRRHLLLREQIRKRQPRHLDEMVAPVLTKPFRVFGRNGGVETLGVILPEEKIHRPASRRDGKIQWFGLGEWLQRLDQLLVRDWIRFDGPTAPATFQQSIRGREINPIIGTNLNKRPAVPAPGDFANRDGLTGLREVAGDRLHERFPGATERRFYRSAPGDGVPGHLLHRGRKELR